MRHQLRYEMERSFIQILSLPQRISLEVEGIRSVQQAAEAVRRRVAAGEDTRLDGNVAAVEVGRAHSKLAGLAAQMIEVRTQLATLADASGTVMAPTRDYRFLKDSTNMEYGGHWPSPSSPSSLSPGVEYIRSISLFGLSSVGVFFKDDVDIYFARRLVGERLLEAKERILQGYGEPERGPNSSGLGQVFWYTIESADGTLSTMDLRTLHDWNIRYLLRTAPGVDDVTSWGGQEKQLHVSISALRRDSDGRERARRQKLRH